MRLKIALLIALGAILIFGSSAMLLVHLREADRQVSEMQRAVASFGDIVTLPALARDIKRGDEIAPTDFAEIRIPAAYVPEGVMSAWPEKTVAGQKYYALNDIKAHQLVASGNVWVGDPGTGPLFSMGKGAVTLSPKNMDELRAALKTGDYVDVYWRRNIGRDASETRQIATALRVLGLPGQVGKSDAAPPAANAFDGRFVIEAGHDKIPVLLQAAAQGDLYIAMSGSSSVDANGNVVVGDDTLRALPLAVRAGGTGPAAPLAEAVDRISEAQQGQKMCNLSVVRSSQRSVIQVPCN